MFSTFFRFFPQNPSLHMLVQGLVSLYFLAMCWQNGWSGGHRTTTAHPVPRCDLPRDGPRERAAGYCGDDADRERLVEGLRRAAVRCSWRVYAFVIMSNHFHLVLKTPTPNLARGMQGFLSAYANAWRDAIGSTGMFSRAGTGSSWWKTRRIFGR